MAVTGELGEPYVSITEAKFIENMKNYQIIN